MTAATGSAPPRHVPPNEVDGEQDLAKAVTAQNGCDAVGIAHGGDVGGGDEKRFVRAGGGAVKAFVDARGRIYKEKVEAGREGLQDEADGLRGDITFGDLVARERKERGVAGVLNEGLTGAASAFDDVYDVVERHILDAEHHVYIVEAEIEVAYGDAKALPRALF